MLQRFRYTETNNFRCNWPNWPEKEASWHWLYIWLIARTCATNINKELIEVVIEELIAQNDIFNKKTAWACDSFYKLSEKEVPLPNANPSIKISNTQLPINSDNEILEPSEEEPRDFDKASNTIIVIQTLTLQKSL